MDDVERRKLLFEKASANSQRRGREELLKRLPTHISEIICNCPCVYFPELDSILRRFLPFTRSRVGSANGLPSGYQFAEVASEGRMFELMSRITVPDSLGTAYLLMREPDGIRFGGREFYVPSIPLFEVDCRWAMTIVQELWKYCDDGLYVVEHDLRAGILVNTYSGIIPEDPNPWEIVYEIGLWPVENHQNAELAN